VVAVMPSFRCADIGMDCRFVAKAITKNGLMKKVQDHASDVHKITSIPDDLRAKIESAIK
jgi:predicted small metal-binding protein